jgi:hypothetical protein
MVGARPQSAAWTQLAQTLRGSGQAGVSVLPGCGFGCYAEDRTMLGGAEFALGALYFFAEDDGFGYSSHGHASLAALLLEHEVGLLFA